MCLVSECAFRRKVKCAVFHTPCSTGSIDKGTILSLQGASACLSCLLTTLPFAVARTLVGTMFSAGAGFSVLTNYTDAAATDDPPSQGLTDTT